MGDKAGHIHDQRYRECEQLIEEGDKEPGLVPERGCGDEAAVPGVEERQPEVDDADKGLGISPEPVRDNVRGEDARCLA